MNLVALLSYHAFCASTVSVVESLPTNNIKYVLEFHHGTSSVARAETIFLALTVVTNDGVMVFLPKLEYGCRMFLFTPEGRRVPMTRLGNLMQSEFESLPESPEAPRTFRRVIQRTGAKRHFVSFGLSQDRPRGVALCSLDKVFELEKGGDYRLVVEPQVYRTFPRRTDLELRQAYQRVRLLPVEAWITVRDELPSPPRDSGISRTRPGTDLGLIWVVYQEEGLWVAASSLVAQVARPWRGVILTFVVAVVLVGSRRVRAAAMVVGRRLWRLPSMCFVRRRRGPEPGSRVEGRDDGKR